MDGGWGLSKQNFERISSGFIKTKCREIENTDIDKRLLKHWQQQQDFVQVDRNDVCQQSRQDEEDIEEDDDVVTQIERKVHHCCG